MKFNSLYTQNAIGDGNLLRIASGDDTGASETAEKLEELGDTEKLPLQY